MEIETVNNFLINGEFKNAPFGLDKDLFIQRFGKSEDFLAVSRKDRRIALLKYGIVEFYFGEPDNFQRLNGVLFKPAIYPSHDLNFNIDLQWVREGLTYKDIRRILSMEGIKFEEKLDEFGQNIIETESKIVFLFFDRYDETNLVDRELNKFGRFLILNNV